MLRDRIRQGSGAGMVAAMQSGALVSDLLVNDMVKERLTEQDAVKGFILDGYPRTLDQAEHLGAWLSGRGIHEVVIHLAVDYNVIIARLTGRRQCPRCGTLYNVASHPPRVTGVCDLDGEALVIREDDREDVIRERLDAYDRQTRPVLEYFRLSGHRVVEVDASLDSPDTVFRKICETIEPAETAESA